MRGRCHWIKWTTLLILDKLWMHQWPLKSKGCWVYLDDDSISSSDLDILLRGRISNGKVSNLQVRFENSNCQKQDKENASYSLDGWNQWIRFGNEIIVCQASNRSTELKTRRFRSSSSRILYCFPCFQHLQLSGDGTRRKDESSSFGSAWMDWRSYQEFGWTENHRIGEEKQDRNFDEYCVITIRNPTFEI